MSGTWNWGGATFRDGDTLLAAIHEFFNRSLDGGRDTISTSDGQHYYLKVSVAVIRDDEDASKPDDLDKYFDNEGEGEIQGIEGGQQ